MTGTTALIPYSACLPDLILHVFPLKALLFLFSPSLPFIYFSSNSINVVLLMISLKCIFSLQASPRSFNHGGFFFTVALVLSYLSPLTPSSGIYTHHYSFSVCHLSFTIWVLYLQKGLTIQKRQRRLLTDHSENKEETSSCWHSSKYEAGKQFAASCLTEPLEEGSTSYLLQAWSVFSTQLVPTLIF